MAGVVGFIGLGNMGRPISDFRSAHAHVRGPSVLQLRRLPRKSCHEIHPS
jgi:3-hydroxyisobutyrate dehydrogenase-like beta-hydroxyacid dehydrogenase